MPELPDVTVYVEALERRIAGRRLERIRILTPFVLRSVDPPVEAAAGREVRGLRRIGKRIVIDLGDELFAVIHLMIAGRLAWKDAAAKPAKAANAIAAFDFSNGTLFFTEAGSRKRASLTIASATSPTRACSAASATPIRTRSCTPRGFRRSSTRARSTRRSPSGSTRRRARRFAAGPTSCAPKRAKAFPRRSRHFARAWRCTDASASPAPSATPRCSASSMPRTSATTARAARLAASCLRTAHCRGC